MKITEKSNPTKLLNNLLREDKLLFKLLLAVSKCTNNASRILQHVGLHENKTGQQQHACRISYNFAA